MCVVFLHLEVVGETSDQLLQSLSRVLQNSALLFGILKTFQGASVSSFPFPMQMDADFDKETSSFEAFRFNVSNSFFIPDSCESTTFAVVS